MTSENWEFWVDVGGTFTDCIGISPDGTSHTGKILSSGIIRLEADLISPCELALTRSIQSPPLTGYKTSLRQTRTNVPIQILDQKGHRLTLSHPINPDDYTGTIDAYSGEPSPIVGIRLLTQTPIGTPLPPLTLMLGTTRGTNTLLERSGPTIGLVTTKGFKDLPHIGDQTRPNLFDLCPDPQQHIQHYAVEVDERVDSSGNILTPMNVAQAEKHLSELRELNVESIAICLVNAYKNDAHELALEHIARKLGFKFVTRSSEISRTQGFLDRLDTALINAYLDPVLTDYIA